METLKDLFQQHQGFQMTKWSGYLDAYHRFFLPYRGRKDLVILEVGVNFGGSLQLWRKYFGPEVRIIGVDVHPACQELAVDAEIWIGSQADRTFLQSLRDRIPPIDILIDDGGHTMQQQLTTFEVLYPHVKPDGLYICEDTHTSYWKSHGGGLRRKGTFIERAKQLVDQLHAQHSKQRHFREDHYTQSMRAVHFYDSLVIIEKGEERSHLMDAGQTLPHQPMTFPKPHFAYRIWQSAIDRLFASLGWKDPFGR